MRTPHQMGLTSLAVASLMACGGGDEAPTTAELAGTWTATKSQYVSTTGIGTVDIIAAGGSSTLVLGTDGSFTFTVTLAGAAPLTATGTYAVNGIDELLITPSPGGAFFPWAFTLSGTTLHLEANTGNSLIFGYDFDGDGTGDAAHWTADFTK